MNGADFELTLRANQKEPDSYLADVRFSGGTIEKPATGARVDIDKKRLRELWADPEAYGRALTEMLFVPELREAWRLALAWASGPLRVRLLLERDIADLHSLNWELLCDPSSPSDPLLLSERILFSRYLVGTGGTPVEPRPRHELRALIAVASPSDVMRYGLAPVKSEVEVALAKRGLGSIPLTLLPDKESPRATLNAIALDMTRFGPDIFYLVCHGGVYGKQPVLFLENTDGKADPVAVADFAARVRTLKRPPLLAVLVSCRSAGSPGVQALAALGPELSLAGVPAVIAMQGNITTDTVAELMPRFLEQLRGDGQIETALAVARAAVRSQPDWWMPALFSRLRDGFVWAAEPPDPARADLLGWLMRERVRIKPTPSETKLDELAGRLTACGAGRVELADMKSTEQLIEEALVLARDTPAAEALTGLVGELFPHPFTPVDLAKLRFILEHFHLRESDPTALTYRALDPGMDWPEKELFQGETTPIGRLMAVCRWLMGQQTPHRHYGRFIVNIARQVLAFEHSQTEHSGRLEAWINAVNQRVARPVAGSNSESPPVRLLIDVAPPAADGADGYLLRAWRYKGDQRDNTFFFRRRVQSLVGEEMAKAVDELLSESPGAALIEFFLPSEVLILGDGALCKYLEFLTPPGRRTIPLGVRRPVVMRLRDRAVRRDWRGQWLEVAKRFAGPNAAVAGKVHWAISPGDCDFDVLSVDLTGGVVALALGLALSDSDEQVKRDVGDALGESGVPVAVWPRRRSNRAEVESALPGLGQAGGWIHLTEQVLEQRRAAQKSKDQNHLGFHLTLLWDDPNRPFPEPDLERTEARHG
jgi:hypothetical protein